jgi:PelA/Pel-15E family pectate lyase
MKITQLLCLLFITFSLTTTSISAQTEKEKSEDYLSMSWKQVATRMPADWYGSDDAKKVAENVLLTQKDIGGWAKNKPYHHIFTEAEKAAFIKSKSEIGATFDNNSTITELRFLAKVYTNIKDERYKKAFDKGLDYIFAAQYQNGGWPQFFPFRTGKSVSYASHITYNDDAMVNTMRFLEEIYTNDKDFTAMQVSDTVKEKAKISFNKGVDCILKTQIVVDGKPTVWCAQHDEVTLAPANARKYELASFSSSESVNIVNMLMNIHHPSKQLIASIDGAVKWFQDHKIEGIRIDHEIDKDGKKNLIVVPDASAEPVWGRFYDLETGKAYFCDRDGIKKSSIAEIGYERRNGYGWYTTSPSKLFEKYPKWKAKLASE